MTTFIPATVCVPLPWIKLPFVPRFTVGWNVAAYDPIGYRNERWKVFNDEKEAMVYARSMPSSFVTRIRMVVTIQFVNRIQRRVSSWSFLTFSPP